MHPPRDDVAADVVVHAERLLVSRERVAVERVRFTKRIVTTTRTIEVPVRIEQLVVSHEPVLEDQAPGNPSNGNGADPGELVIVLHEEVPEVTVRVQPVERVTIAVRTVTREETITAELRRETVDLRATSGGHDGELLDPPS